MRALVVYCHPRPDSFTAAVRDVILETLQAAGADTRLLDLYAIDFNPIMGHDELGQHFDTEQNQAGLERHVADLQWCDTLIFCYPTWWYGLPAMLKGWLDRAFLPGVAFLMPDSVNSDIRPGLQHITRLGVFTTCGASWWLTRLIGAPGRRTLLRGVGLLCAPRCRKVFLAHYLMDSSTAESRAKHLTRVAAKMQKFLGVSQQNKEVTA
ncbi:MAG: NAD(P)H-dependent oxidoreductase [Pseudomonadota bacterium]